MNTAHSVEENAQLKLRVKQHWEDDTCGIRFAEDATGDFAQTYEEVDRQLYQIDYMRPGFANFTAARDKRVLEVGLGVGSDLIRWARAGAQTWGVDLTEASVSLIRKRLEAEGLHAEVLVGDAESLPFSARYFDIYYAWGVLHHTPDTDRALAEAWRVLKPGGALKLMLYHYPSVFAWMVWALHGPLRGEFAGPRAVVRDHLESPGTKCYTVDEVRQMLARTADNPSVGQRAEIRTYLASPDLLTFKLSSKYQGLKWRLLQRFYPCNLVKRFIGDRYGFFMTVEVTKPV